MITINIEMPTCCSECFALDDHGDYPFCLITQESRGYNFDTLTKRMDSCPLKDSKTQAQPKVMIKPEFITETCNHFQCPICKNYIIYNQSYCSKCGTQFTWHDGYNKINSTINQYTKIYNQ